MSLAISFATVHIHWESMPRGELIRSEQKKRASRQPILDFLQAPVVQLRACLEPRNTPLKQIKIDVEFNKEI